MNEFKWTFLLLGWALLASNQAVAKVSAGFASVDLGPQMVRNKVAVAGYGYGARRRNPLNFSRGLSTSLFEEGKGFHSPILAKAAFFQSTNKTNGKTVSDQLIWVSIDAVGITAAFIEDLKAELLKQHSFDLDHLFISATHTHSGPGNLAENLFWEIAAMGWYSSQFYRDLIETVALAILNARDRAEDVELFSLSTKVNGLQRNRRKAAAPVDPSAHLLIARNRVKEWSGALVHYGIHGTALGPQSLRFSSDVPGGIESALKAKLDLKSVPLFLNGVEGDVAPAMQGESGIATIGQSFADQIAPQIPSLLKPVKFDLEVTSKKITLPSAYLDTKTCTEFDSTLVDLIDVHQSAFQTQNVGEVGEENAFQLPLSTWVPSSTEIWSVKLGDLQFLTWPGEPTESVGRALKKITGRQDPWVISLTNDYHGYFTSPSEFAGGTYESCFSLHGSDAGNIVLQGFENLLATSSSGLKKPRPISSQGVDRNDSIPSIPEASQEFRPF